MQKEQEFHIKNLERDNALLKEEAAKHREISKVGSANPDADGHQRRPNGATAVKKTATQGYIAGIQIAEGIPRDHAVDQEHQHDAQSHPQTDLSYQTGVPDAVDFLGFENPKARPRRIDR